MCQVHHELHEHQLHQVSDIDVCFLIQFKNSGDIPFVSIQVGSKIAQNSIESPNSQEFAEQQQYG